MNWIANRHLFKPNWHQMRHLHATLPDAVSDELESQQDCVAQDLQARKKLENSKADKREGSTV